MRMLNSVEVIIERNRLGPEMSLKQGGKVILTAGIHGGELNCYWPSQKDLGGFEEVVRSYSGGEIAWTRGREAICGIMDRRGFSIEPLYDRVSRVNGWIDLSDKENLEEAVLAIAQVASKTVNIASPLQPELIRDNIQNFLSMYSPRSIYQPQ